jgi:CRP-like cAMP-binding protein
MRVDPGRGDALDEGVPGPPTFLFSHIRDAADAASRNRLLAALTAADLGRLVPHLERVHLARGAVLLEPRIELEYVWFPESCVVSLTIPMADGAGAEAATVGREGMLGFVAALGSRRTIACSVVQVPGTALRLPVGPLRSAFGASPRVRQVCLSYVEAVLVYLLQSVACNALHKAEARLARWLLLFQDRLEGAAELPLTQELLAGMLGVRRGTINEAARALQRAGLIATKRRRLMVLDRAGLEAASCECYAALRAHYEHLLPPAEAAPGKS